MKVVSLSATASRASSRRSTRSIRHSLANSTAERARLPRCSSSFASKRAKSVNASAAAPAKPASTRSWYTLRTLRAPAFTMVCPIETWPSPATATRPRWRTHTTVVAWIGAIGSLIIGTGHSGRPRMGGIVHPHQVLRADVGVALGRRQAAVAEQLLDQPQVRALPEHVGREAVAQRMRSHPLTDAGALGPPAHHPVRAARAEPAPARVQEQGPATTAPQAEIGTQGVERSLADRY